MQEIFGSLYLPSEEDAEGFKGAYKPPKGFKHGKWHRVATYRKENPRGSGEDAFVLECRMPARFFKVKVAPRCGKVYYLQTGSGEEMAKLAASLAKAISQGMLSLEIKEDEE